MAEFEQEHLFCFGLGFTASKLCEALRADGWQTSGTVRSMRRRRQIRAHHDKVHLFSPTKPLSSLEEVLTDVTHLLVSVRPLAPEETLTNMLDPILNLHADDLLNHADSLQWVGYLSSTVVYGDHSGKWVDESSELRTKQDRGLRRIEAERRWLTLWKEFGLPVHVFRLSGIYAAGRSAIDSVKSGKATLIDKPGHFTSRVHVEDIVQVLRASMAQPAPGSIYNVADDLPCEQREPLEFAADLLGQPKPPTLAFEDLEDGSFRRSFMIENRRVRNDAIKEQLGVTLKYPTFREGIRAIASVAS